MNQSQFIASELLKIKAVFLRPNKPFTWASGIKSPIYCDNRLIISYPKTRQIVEKQLANLIKQKFPRVKAIVGTATAGIAHAAYVSQILDLPAAYVRSQIKDHGRAKHIEGELRNTMPIVVVEDLISTGGSSIEVCEILKKHKLKVLGLVSIFTYNTQSSINKFRQSKIKHFSLTSLDDLLKVALQQKNINKSQYAKILKFRDSL